MNIQEKPQAVITQEKPKNPSFTNVFQRILVAVDYLDSNPKVFEQAIQLAKQNGSLLKIFHSVQGQIGGMPEMITSSSFGTYAGVYSTEMIELEEKLIQERIEELQAWLTGLAKQATDAGIIADFDYQMGDTETQICDVAKTWGADLIIIGRRGRKGLSEMLLGSVSNYVVHHAHCSVLVVQHD